MRSWPRHRHFRVVVNGEGQYGIWPVDSALPSGWWAVGFAGTRPSCLGYVAETWRDMRPRTVARRPAAGARPATPSMDSSGAVAQAGPTAMPAMPATPATLVDLFARGANRQPGAVAVSDDAGQLTYAELAVRSDRLAMGLAALGVAAEDRVLLALPSSVDSVVALVGVAKAGAASLPIDTDGLGSDVAGVLGVASVQLVLTRPGGDRPVSRLRAASQPGPQTVDWGSAMTAGALPAALAGQPDGPAGGNAACVLPARSPAGELRYVVLEHRQLVPLALDPTLLALQPGDRAAPATGLAAAAAQVEIWRALAEGAEIVVLPPDQRSSPDLAAALGRREVSALSAPAAEVDRLARLPAAGGEPAGALAGALGSLRMLHATGTGLQPATVRALRAAGFTGRLLTRYGPVETAATAAVHELSGEPERTDGVPLGRPPAGVRLYVLQEDLGPVPPGTPGELYVGGVAVGRGYLDDPERTADAFLPDPFSSGGRMYPTGELVTRQADGVLRHLGPAGDP